MYIMVLCQTCAVLGHPTAVLGHPTSCSYDNPMGHPTHPMGQFNGPFIRQFNGCIGPSYPSNGPIQLAIHTTVQWLYWAILPIQWANPMGHPTHPMGQFNGPFIRQSNGCIGPSYFFFIRQWTISNRYWPP